MCAPTSRHNEAVTGGFYPIGVEILAISADKVATQSAFHSSNAAVAEVKPKSSMPVVFLFTEFVEPVMHYGRDGPLLHSPQDMLRFSGRHLLNLSDFRGVNLRTASAGRWDA